MTVENSAVSDQADVESASGTEGNDTTQDKVDYKTYQRTLEQKKKRDEELSEMKKKLEEFEAEKEAERQRVLKEKEDFKTLYEDAQKKAQEAEEKLTSKEKEELAFLKISKVLEKIPGRIANEDYYNFLKIEDVIIDPITNDVSPESVERVANEFIKNHSRLIEHKKTPDLPSDTPQSTKPLTYDQWLKLPTKEKAARIKDVKN